jgi:DNA-binding HxlR family transcriptional regulator
MNGDATPRPDEVLEDVAYLLRAETRTRVLDALAATSHTPRALSEHTDIPRSTLRRTLTEMVERGWVERTIDGEYVLTPPGEHVATETGRYLDAIAAIRVLGDAVAWLPDDELTVDLRHFSDATVRRPEPNAVSAPSTVATERLQEATEFSCLVNTLPSLGFERAMIRGVVDERLTTTHVITDVNSPRSVGTPNACPAGRRTSRPGPASTATKAPFRATSSSSTRRCSSSTDGPRHWRGSSVRTRRSGGGPPT